jgi:tetratricopeptide (TPR) repeat protein
MRVLERWPEIEKLLASAASPAVRDAIARARATGEPSTRPYLAYAEGALALREGSLVAAGETLRSAASELSGAGDREASELAELEALIADARRGLRDLATSARARAHEIAAGGPTSRVRVAALVTRGTAERVLGDAAAAQRSFLEALEHAADAPDLKTQALTSLGTLFVVTGALGAARTMLEPAAELCHARGDVVGEAIAMGQLGAVAMGLGDLQVARQRLSRQEWLARQVGDVLGRTRALVWLAEVALEMGAPDDAAAIAERARASAVEASLGTFEAYAERVLCRAKRLLGEPSRAHGEAAYAIFHRQGLPLGEALAAWDLSLGETPIDRERLAGALRALASLGLVDRVVEVLSDLREAGERPSAPGHRHPDVALLLMTAAQSGRRAESLESSLAHEDPAALAGSVDERGASRRNLARLAALSIAPPGLMALAVVNGAANVLRERSFTGALVGQIDVVRVFVWPASDDVATVARDVASALGVEGRGAMTRREEALVEAPGFGGAVGARLSGLDLGALLAAALAGPPAADLGGARLTIAGTIGEDVESALAAEGVALARAPR